MKWGYNFEPRNKLFMEVIEVQKVCNVFRKSCMESTRTSYYTTRMNIFFKTLYEFCEATENKKIEIKVPRTYMRFGCSRYRVSSCPPTTTTFCGEDNEDFCWFKIRSDFQVFNSSRENVGESTNNPQTTIPMISVPETP